MQGKRECKHPCCGPVCRKKKPKRPRTRIAKVSKKRAGENRVYGKERKEFLEANPFCQYPDCNKGSTDVHHGKGRGKYFLDKSTWKALCREHHKRVEERPLEAKQIGLSESRLK